MVHILYPQPAGLAVDNVAPPKKEGLDHLSYREEKSGQTSDLLLRSLDSVSHY